MKSKFISVIILLELTHLLTAYINPVQSIRDSPDPGVILNVDGYYYAATTGGWDGSKFPIWKSKDLTGWTHVGFAFKQIPAWTNGGDFWAPEIHIVGKLYNLYYTARTKAGKLCIGVAFSDHILGPYNDIGKPLYEQEDLGIIDATYFKSQDNKNWLIYKTDGNAVRKPTQIYIIQLSENGRQVIGNRVFLLRDTLPFEGGIIQAPWVIHYNNFYYLFYSACGYANRCYSLSVARSKSLIGGYEKFNQTILHTKSPQTDNSMEGPGHCSVVRGVNGNWAVVYHAWPHNAIGTKRLMLLDKITWTPEGWPYIGTPSQTNMPIP